MADDDTCYHQHPMGPPGRVIMHHQMSEPCLLREQALRADLAAERTAREAAEAQVAALREQVGAIADARLHDMAGLIDALLNLVRSIRTDGGVADDDWPELAAADKALTDTASLARAHDAAVRERALEEAAQVADVSTYYDSSDVADDIRALKNKAPS